MKIRSRLTQVSDSGEGGKHHYCIRMVANQRNAANQTAGSIGSELYFFPSARSCQRDFLRLVQTYILRNMNGGGAQMNMGGNAQ